MKEENIRDKIREICGNYMEQPNAEPVVGYEGIFSLMPTVFLTLMITGLMKLIKMVYTRVQTKELTK